MKPIAFKGTADQQRWRQCDGKQVFATEALARGDVRPGRGHGAYLCPECGQWHRTHQPARKRRGGFGSI